MAATARKSREAVGASWAVGVGSIGEGIGEARVGTDGEIGGRLR